MIAQEDAFAYFDFYGSPRVMHFLTRVGVSPCAMETYTTVWISPATCGYDTMLIGCFLIGVTALRFEKMSWAFHDGLGEADAPFPEIAFEVRSHRRKVRPHGEVKPQRGLR